MSDINYDALFGVDTQGAEETETAEPSEPEESVGVNEQEAAETAETETENTDITVEEDKGQEKDVNAKFAAARRKAEAERDAAIAKAKEEAQKTIDDAFRESGMTNPYTGKPITSQAEFREYKDKYDAQKKESVIRKSGMSDDEFTQFIESLPQVKEAQIAKAQAEKALKKAQEAEMKVAIDEQLKEIGQIDPSIKSVEDFRKMDNYDTFYNFVTRGLNFAEAYKLANYDKITQQTAKAAQRAALNTAQSKNHLAATAQRGAGSVTVPADIKAEYREFNPGMTDAEIEKHYNNYLRQKG